ncbi:fumarylacetoacetate hydrolase family protein [Streptosporangium sp. CA-135522]|uniref:fumarylacetoacetate hydrolase family protein n=1 Tax=Streptosporangium sp. CA-135522 TaxID=3240072 RepID=UPI003D89B6F9
MKIVRFIRVGEPEIGVLRDGLIGLLPGTLAGLLARPLDEIRSAVTGTRGTVPVDGVRLLPPVDGRMEVWGAGVTYEQSRAARVEESGLDVYDKVYAADRPELFFKSVAWRVTSHGDEAGIRADAVSCIPEPELAVVVNRFGDLVGATVCDDLTARSIEGENPLYLPQAKTFHGSCALAPGIRPWWELPAALDIEMTITRSGSAVFSGATSTARLRRGPAELVEWLFRAQSFPDGVILSTGTGIVPPPELSLQPGDEITISIRDVGELRQRVQGCQT